MTLMAGTSNVTRAVDAVDAVSGEGVLPPQHFPAARRDEPEHRLMIAVLQSAIECLEKHRSATDSHGQRLFREAQEWFLVGAVDWPCSFEGICAVLDLDAAAVRQHLRVAADALLTPDQPRVETA